MKSLYRGCCHICYVASNFTAAEFYARVARPCAVLAEKIFVFKTPKDKPEFAIPSNFKVKEYPLTELRILTL